MKYRIEVYQSPKGWTWQIRGTNRKRIACRACRHFTTRGKAVRAATDFLQVMALDLCHIDAQQLPTVHTVSRAIFLANPSKA